MFEWFAYSSLGSLAAFSLYLIASKASLRSKLDRLEDQYYTRWVELCDAKKSKELLTEAIHAAKRQHDEKHVLWTSCSANLAKANSQISEMQGRIERLQEANNEVNRKNDDYKMVIDELDEAVEDLKCELKNARKPTSIKTAVVKLANRKASPKKTAK